MFDQQLMTDTDALLYSLLIKESKDTAIIALDANGHVVLWNEGAERLYGYSESEIKGQHFSIFYSVADIAGHKPDEALAQAKLKGRFEMRDWRVRKDHTVFWAHGILNALYDEYGNLRGFSKITQDESNQKKIEDFNRHVTQLLEKSVKERTEELSQANQSLRQEILHRRKAEESLRISEEKFRVIFEQAAVGMGRVNFKDARWIDVNHAFCLMLGRTREEILATPWPAMTNPEDLDLDLIPFQRMAAGELNSYSVEKRFIHKLGYLVWARLTLSLVRDEHGKPNYEIAIIEDITERKNMESQAILNEAKLKAIFDSAPAGIFVSDKLGKLEYLNQAGIEIWGEFRAVDSTNHYGEYRGWWLESGKPIDAHEWALARAVEKGENVKPARARIEDFSGNEKYILMAANPIRGKKGEIIGGVGTNQDITEVIRAERELEKSQEQLSLAVKYARVGFFDWNLITDHLVFSDQMMKDWGIQPGTYGEKIEAALEIIHPEDRDRVKQLIHEAINQHKPYDIEYRVVHPDGKIVWADVHGVVTYQADGTPIRMFGTSVDITNRKRAEEATKGS